MNYNWFMSCLTKLCRPLFLLLQKWENDRWRYEHYYQYEYFIDPVLVLDLKFVAIMLRESKKRTHVQIDAQHVH